ncbi:MAG: hypothetical protein ACJAYF_003629 [Arenicella sp.]|jgi:hypothetical protein
MTAFLLPFVFIDIGISFSTRIIVSKDFLHRAVLKSSMTYNSPVINVTLFKKATSHGK